jgi:hypothetical protein
MIRIWFHTGVHSVCDLGRSCLLAFIFLQCPATTLEYYVKASSGRKHRIGSLIVRGVV